MALIVETGAIVPNANSYISAAEYIAWADDRFDSGRATAPASEAEAEPLILRATDYFESQMFQGEKTDSDQPMQWPRAWVTIDGFDVGANEIPKEVKLSIYELAYAEEQGNSELSSVDRKVKREKVSSIEVEYADSSSSTVINRSISLAMRKLLAYGGGANRVFRV